MTDHCFFSSHKVLDYPHHKLLPYVSITAPSIHDRTRGGDWLGSGDGGFNGCGVDLDGNERALYFPFSMFHVMHRSISCDNNAKHNQRRGGLGRGEEAASG